MIIAPRCAVRLAGGGVALLGYACQNLTLARAQRTLRLATLRAGGLPVLQAIVDENLTLLADMLDWNAGQGIAMFRISSDLVPFGSHEEVELERIAFAPEAAGRIAAHVASMRFSMHPGQFTVLSSPDQDVVRRSLDELSYHAEIMERLGIGGDIVLHGGGVYGDRAAAAERLSGCLRALPDPIRLRLRLENDERSWSVADLLPICEATGVPLVVDTLHHAILGATPLESLPWPRIAGCWSGRRPKIHYSEQDPEKRPGAHSAGATPDLFLHAIDAIAMPAFDIMLECKQKERALLALMEGIDDRAL